jgi:hypothetical protein
MNIATKLSRLFAVVAKEAKSNPQFAERLAHAIGEPSSATQRPAGDAGKSVRHRRSPATIEPFEDYRKAGEPLLRHRLGSLDLEQLRDIIAQFGMDRSKLAMKWKDRERVVDFIVSTVAQRARKGDVFRSPEQNAPPTVNPISRTEAVGS